MIDTRSACISSVPQILSRHWPTYRAKYQEVEAGLPRPSQIVHPFFFKTHPLGGFFVGRRSPDSPLKEFFEDSGQQFLLIKKEPRKCHLNITILFALLLLMSGRSSRSLKLGSLMTQTTARLYIVIKS